MWPQPPLGKKRRVLRNSRPVTRTAGIVEYSRLKALAVNGAGHPDDVALFYFAKGQVHQKGKSPSKLSTLAGSIARRG